jgi:hypothetical protein
MADRAVSADARADAEIEWRYAMRNKKLQSSLRLVVKT